jgi:hypothetical protein
MESEYSQFIRDVRDDVSDTKVSILLGSDPTGVNTDQSRIALRHALDHLADLAMPEPAITYLMEVGTEARSTDFWRHHRAPGLAIYASEHVRAVLDLPSEPKHHAGAGQVFRVLEVFAAAQRPASLLLALSAGAARVFRLEAGSATPTDVEGMPTNLDEVAQFADIEPSLQRHASTRGGDMVSHGQEGGSRQLDHLRDRYFRLVDAAVAAKSDLRTLPVILAGVDEVTAAFRMVSSLPYVARESISGNHDRTSAWHLAALANAVVGAMPNPQLDHDRAALQAPSRKATTGVESTFRAAESGRVEAVFIPLDRRGHGHALDEIALTVDRHGGRVWIEEDDADRDVEALLRF